MIPLKISLNGFWLPVDFVSISGAGATAVYYVMIDKRYVGRLRKQDTWIFDGNGKSEMGEEFCRFMEFITEPSGVV